MCAPPPPNPLAENPEDTVISPYILSYLVTRFVTGQGWRHITWKEAGSLRSNFALGIAKRLDVRRARARARFLFLVRADARHGAVPNKVITHSLSMSVSFSRPFSLPPIPTLWPLFPTSIGCYGV